MRFGLTATAATIGAMLLLAQGSATRAAEIKLLSSVGVRSVLQELAPQFERGSEHKLAITFGVAATLKRQIEAGESFDVAILTPAMIEDLVKQGKVAAGSGVNVARSGIGVAIRAGAAKPDIATPEAFKRTLLAAKSITYVQEGASGVLFARLLERLGIAEEMKAKTKLQQNVEGFGEAVASGEAELGFVLITEILAIRGVELAGPLPAEMQSYVVLAAGIGANAKEPEAGKALIKFLTAPAAFPVIKAKGMEPG